MQAAPEVIPGRAFVWGKHIDVLCNHLQAVSQGHIDRLLINLPPGCTKSTILSVLWPAWTWATRPDRSFMCVSYNSDLTIRDSIACRELIAGDWYQKRWGVKVQVRFGEDAKSYYRLEQGGWRLSTTRRGRATGDHPDIVIIDDPLSAEGAKVANERKAFADWYRDTLASRGVTRGVKHVVAHQRLHVEDCSADFERENEQARQAGEPLPWAHVRLPMRYDPRLAMQDIGWGGDWRTLEGELLYPQLLDEEKVSKLERRLGKANTAAQLQQNPQVRDGDFFLMTNLLVIHRDELPLRFDAVCRFWDRAATDEGDGAYTAGALVGRKADRFFLLDMIRKRLRSGAVENLIEQMIFVDETTYGKDRLTTCFEVEPGSGGKRQAEITKNRLRGHRVFGIPARLSKEAHAEPLAIAIENKEVFVANGPYVPELFDEMQGFPTGKYKDQTDAFAGAYLELVLPSTKVPSLTISEGAGAQSIPEVFRSQEGKCRNRACQRPAFEPDGFCCDCCRRTASQAEAPERHDPNCNAKFNDWWVKKG